MYNFDEIIDRRHTNAMNTDGFRDYIFHADETMTFPYKDEEFIRMWVADMEFATPDVVIDGIKERLSRRIFGYTRVFEDSYYEAFSGWCRERYGWSFEKKELVMSNGIIPALYELVEYICAPDEKVLFLSDILPTAWQAVKNAEVKPGSSVAIFGAGPVGLLCASCARLNGAEQIFIIDHNDYRLDFAQQRYGAIPINFDHHDDPAQWIIDNTPGHRGVDAVIDAVGFEAKGSLTETVLSTLKIEGSSGKALRQCIAAVRRGGIVSVPGVYAGFIHGFMFGDAFDKGLTFRMGQTHVHAWLPDLLALIEQGLLTPEEIVTHHMPLEEAARGYQIFEKREEACRKVILVPGMQPGKATL